MINLDEIQTGDILQFKPKGFLGKAISWFSSGNYAHTAMVYRPELAFEMGGSLSNAGAVFRDMQEVIEEAGSENIDVYRVYLDDCCPFDNLAQQHIFWDVCLEQKGKRYAFRSQIGIHAIHGLLGKIPLVNNLLNWRKRADNPYADDKDVCSTLMEECIQEALSRGLNRKMDLWPHIGANWLRPADVPTSKFVRQIS